MESDGIKCNRICGTRRRINYSKKIVTGFKYWQYFIFLEIKKKMFSIYFRGQQA